MPIEVETENSPGWWFQRLQQKRLGGSGTTSRQDRLERLWKYTIGDPPLPEWTERHQDTTKAFLRLGRNQYPLLICEALLHRTRWLGLRTSQDQDADGDDLAREIAATSGFAAVSADALMYEYSLSEGYLMVNPPDKDNGYELPVFTAEDPRNVITAQDPLRPLVTRAALKIYKDDDRGLEVAHVFTPGRVDVATRKLTAGSSNFFAPQVWDWDDRQSGPYPSGMGLDKVVPIVKLTNRLGMGEFEPHIDVIDRIHNGIADRLWIAKLQAHRQLAVKGDLDDTDPETGEEIDYDEVLSRDPGSVWKLPPNTELWESGQLDLTPVLSSVKDDVRELSAVTHTPMYVFSPDAAGGSAAGANLMREGGSFKADDRNGRNTPPMVAGWRIALLMAGQKERADGFLQAMWAPTERYSLQERGAAAAQAKGSGVTWRTTMSDVWQFDPETVARMETERDADLLYQVQQLAVQQVSDPASPPTPSAVEDPDG